MINKEKNIEIITREKDWYRKKIVDMIKDISDDSHIKMIYGFIKKIYENM